MPQKRWPNLLRPATRAFLQEVRRTPDYSLFDWLHGYIYGRWPYFYIGMGTGEHPLVNLLGKPLRRLLHVLIHRGGHDGSPQRFTQAPHARSEGVTFADTYHGKVLPLESAKRLVTVRQDISLTNLEHVIPYARARHIILRNPDHIVVLDCPCRSVRSDPCSPLDVCLIIGEPFASFVIEHHPHRARWITSDEALEILQAEHQRGHVHHAFFKDAMLNRFYAICNCCSCCCGAMQAWRNGVPMLAASGYVCQIDQDVCGGCGTCVELCQFGAISLNGELAVLDGSLCMGCGVCASNCPQEAISMLRDASKGEPLEICELIAEVA